MLRRRAVHSLLFEEVAELRPAASSEALPKSIRDSESDDQERQRAAIDRARKRAALVAALDLLAILILFAFRQRAEPFLVLGGTEQGLFTLGVLAVAVHAGYRLGQRQKLGAVLRAWDTLP